MGHGSRILVAYPYMKILFAGFIFIAGLALVSVVPAIFIELHMNATLREQEAEEENKKLQLFDKLACMVRHLFEITDTDRSGTVSVSEMQQVLSDRATMQELQKLIRESGLVKEEDVRAFRLGLYELWEDTNEEEDQDIELDEEQFVHGVLKCQEVNLPVLWRCITSVRLHLRRVEREVVSAVEKVETSTRDELALLKNQLLDAFCTTTGRPEASTKSTEEVQFLHDELGVRKSQLTAATRAACDADQRAAQAEQQLVGLRCELDSLRRSVAVSPCSADMQETVANASTAATSAKVANQHIESCRQEAAELERLLMVLHTDAKSRASPPRSGCVEAVAADDDVCSRNDIILQAPVFMGARPVDDRPSDSTPDEGQHRHSETTGTLISDRGSPNKRVQRARSLQESWSQSSSTSGAFPAAASEGRSQPKIRRAFSDVWHGDVQGHVEEVISEFDKTPPVQHRLVLSSSGELTARRRSAHSASPYLVRSTSLGGLGQLRTAHSVLPARSTSAGDVPSLVRGVATMDVRLDGSGSVEPALPNAPSHFTDLAPVAALEAAMWSEVAADLARRPAAALVGVGIASATSAGNGHALPAPVRRMAEGVRPLSPCRVLSQAAATP